MENPVTTSLGAKLRGQFETVKGERLEVERRWLSDLRQFRGFYEPEEEQRIGATKSKSFTRITRIKVKSATARLMDMVFPAGSEDNWSITPTPVPDITPSPDIIAQVTRQTGQVPTGEQLRMIIEEQAEHASKLMEQEIKDQLVEVKYRRIMKQTIQSGNLFGTGVLKGPLVNRSYRKQWTLNPDGSWALINTPKTLPFIEFTPVWELYPDTSATSFADARFNFQRSIMPKHTVLELAKRKDFKRDEIIEYVKANSDGDAQPTHWEQELRRLGWNISTCTPKSKRYEVLEFWGVIEAQELIDLGLQLPDDTMQEYWTNAWLLGSKIIKIEVQPIEGMQLPYYAYYWDKDETSIFGEGIPSIMRDDQSAFNASTRAMMDNAAICAGPQLEVNVDLLHPDENPRDVHPFKVWLRTGVGAEAQYPALRAFNLPSHTAEYMQLANFFMNNINEATLPSYLHGEATSKGSVGRTATGLSILMSAAQITFKDQLFSLDDDVQRPFIEAMYHWNMQFNPKEEIKGDYSIVVKGTSSLVAREIRAQNLDQFAASTLNQFDLPFVDRHVLNKQRAQVLELGDEIIRDKDQAMALFIEQLVNNAERTGTAPFRADTSASGGVQSSAPSGQTTPFDTGRTSVFDVPSSPVGGAQGGDVNGFSAGNAQLPGGGAGSTGITQGY